MESMVGAGHAMDASDGEGTAEGSGGSRTRRALIIAGAATVGAGMLGTGTAQAANGDSVRLGRWNYATRATRVSMNYNASTLYVRNTNTGGYARGLRAVAVGGNAVRGESTQHTGGVFRTKSRGHFGMWASNDATTTGAGGAMSAQGNNNHGLIAVTKNANRSAIHARNTSAGDGNAITGLSSGVSSFSGLFAAGQFAGSNALSAVATAAGGYGLHATSTGGAAVNAVANGSSGDGVRGIASGSNGYGVWAVNSAGDSYALVASGQSFLTGNVFVGGNLSKSSGSFVIDHPLDPANRYLSHSFVESPDMMNVYNGNVEADASGEAVVELPEYFEALNRDFRYQLTPIGGPAAELHVKSDVSGNSFTIAGAKAGQRISWQVTGVRQDAWANENRIVVEQDKPTAELGSYIFPQGFGKPSSVGLAAKRTAAKREAV